MHTSRIIAAAVLLSFAGSRPSVSQAVYVAIVVDGDRIILSDGARLQLVGVNAPEKHPTAKLTAEALSTGRTEEAVMRQGEIAASYLTTLALGRSVSVIYERPRPVLGQPGGPYAPALVYVLDERGHPVYSLNERMIGDGYAYLDATAGFSLRSKYQRLAIAARAKKLGLWADGSPYSSSTMPQSRNSEGADLFAACRQEASCVWVSQNGLPQGVGFWRSKPGTVCSCEGMPR